jgi:hypothetical protein
MSKEFPTIRPEALEKYTGFPIRLFQEDLFKKFGVLEEGRSENEEEFYLVSVERNERNRLVKKRTPIVHGDIIRLYANSISRDYVFIDASD